MIVLHETEGGVLLPVKVVPGASRTRRLGELGGRLKVAVTCPPEGGKANKALVAWIARQLGVARSAVTVEAGHTSPHKTLRVTGVTSERIRRSLGIPAD